MNALDERNELPVQQEIAPLEAENTAERSLPAEQKPKKWTWKSLLDYLIFGNRIRLRNKTQYIAYIAVLTALAVVLNLSMNFGAGEESKLTLLYIPLFITGIYFGPLVAAAVGALSKIVGSLVFTQYMPWTTNIVSAALMGVIMSLCVQLLKRLCIEWRIIIGAVIVCFTVTLGLNTLAFTYEPYSAYAGWTYWQVLVFTAPPRLLVQPLVLAFNTALVVFLAKPLDAYFKGKI